MRGTADGWLIALDIATGEQVWASRIADSDDGRFISMPPLIVDDLVLIGPAGSEWASKGWVGAFSLQDGKPVWKFNTVPDPGETGSETWGGNPEVLASGGGDLWTPMSYDVAKGLLYVAVGNLGPTTSTRTVRVPTCIPTAWWRSMCIRASWRGTTRRSRTTCWIST